MLFSLYGKRKEQALHSMFLMAIVYPKAVLSKSLMSTCCYLYIFFFSLCWLASSGHLCLQDLGCTLVSELSACRNWQQPFCSAQLGEQPLPAHCVIHMLRLLIAFWNGEETDDEQNASPDKFHSTVNTTHLAVNKEMISGGAGLCVEWKKEGRKGGREGGREERKEWREKRKHSVSKKSSCSPRYPGLQICKAAFHTFSHSFSKATRPGDLLKNRSSSFPCFQEERLYRETSNSIISTITLQKSTTLLYKHTVLLLTSWPKLLCSNRFNSVSHSAPEAIAFPC